MRYFNTRLVMALLALAGVAASGLSAAENLIKNESFEDANPDYPAAPLGFGPLIRQGTNGVDRRYQWVDAGRSFQKAFKSEATGESIVLRPSLQVEALELNKLYRYSFWYRTESAGPESKALSINPVGFYYPTVLTWTQARVFFENRDKRTDLDVSINSFHGGTPAYRKDGKGKLARDAQGRPIVTNGVPLTVYIDDFELRSVGEMDYAGNMIENGDFEMGQAGTMAPGWVHKFGSGCTVIDRVIAHSGRQSLRTEGQKEALYGNAFPVKAGAIYSLSVWLKSEPSIEVTLRLITQDGKGFLWERSDELRADWKRYQYYIEIPRADDLRFPGKYGLVVLRIDYGLRGPARRTVVWLDDVKLIEELPAQ